MNISMICVDILITFTHHSHLRSYSSWWLFVWSSRWFGLSEMPWPHNALNTLYTRIYFLSVHETKPI